MAPVRIKTAMVRLMAKGWPVCIRFSRLAQGLFIMEKPAPVAVTIPKALSVPAISGSREYSGRILDRFFRDTPACNATRGFLYDSMPNRQYPPAPQPNLGVPNGPPI